MESRKSLWEKPFFRALRRARLAKFGVAVLFLVVVVALAAPLLTPHEPNDVVITRRLLPPQWSPKGQVEFPLGTDQLGRDVLSRVMHGARISLIVGVSAVAIAGTLGITLGLVSGYFGGRVDDLIMRIAEIQMAFPPLLLFIAAMSVLGQGLLNVILVLGVSGWVNYARVVRGAVLSVRELDYVEAARAMGGTSLRIIFRHILRNVVAPAIVIASFSVAQSILAESSLSFLGLGVPSSVPTWGSMLADARTYIRHQPWLSVFPGVAIMLTVLGINVVGDWLRDYLDPKVKT